MHCVICALLWFESTDLCRGKIAIILCHQTSWTLFCCSTCVYILRTPWHGWEVDIAKYVFKSINDEVNMSLNHGYNSMRSERVICHFHVSHKLAVPECKCMPWNVLSTFNIRVHFWILLVAVLWNIEKPQAWKFALLISGGIMV